MNARGAADAVRAVHVVPRVVSESSGPSHSVPHLCSALAGDGVQVALMVLEPLPGRALPFPATAHPTLRLPGCHRLGVSPAMRRALDDAARVTDIIHSHSLWMMPNVYPGAVARKAGCRLVIAPRGTLEWSAWQRSRWRKSIIWRLGQGSTLASADMLHATAPTEYDAIRRHGLRQPVVVLPNGVEMPAPDLADAHDGSGLELLFLSRLHPHKQVGRLLRAWHRLEHQFPQWRLTIAGPLGSAHAHGLLDLAASLDLRRVTFTGELTGDAKSRAYRRSDLFVLPTRSENFGLAVAEALAAGTPVITTHGAPWRDVVGRDCGWWIPDDEASLEATLRHAMSMPRTELRGMGENGRRWMEAEFSWSSIGKRMAETYRWLLGRAGRPDWVYD